MCCWCVLYHLVFWCSVPGNQGRPFEIFLKNIPYLSQDFGCKSHKNANMTLLHNASHQLLHKRCILCKDSLELIEKNKLWASLHCQHLNWGMLLKLFLQTVHLVLCLFPPVFFQTILFFPASSSEYKTVLVFVFLWGYMCLSVCRWYFWQPLVEYINKKCPLGICSHIPGRPSSFALYPFLPPHFFPVFFFLLFPRCHLFAAQMKPSFRRLHSLYSFLQSIFYFGCLSNSLKFIKCSTYWDAQALLAFSACVPWE